ncbi:PadR family transcriptional regulator [Candidatus Woesearchaeota archaeon]|nr:MAG: PadR family transcriptional regulator [Candidatus Woesearchaeota archaeon]
MIHHSAGQLKLLILKILSESPMNGYALIKEIKFRTGFWNPSPGSIYPLLNAMHSDGFLTLKKEGRRKIYSLTLKGNKLLSALDNHKAKVGEHIVKNIEIFETLIGPKAAEELRKMFETIHSGAIHSSPFFAEMLELKIELAKLSRLEMPPETVTKIRNQLKHLTTELRKVRSAHRAGNVRAGKQQNKTRKAQNTGIR